MEAAIIPLVPGVFFARTKYNEFVCTRVPRTLHSFAWYRAAMQRWEYITVLVTSEEELTTLLATHGRTGWELVSAVSENRASQEPQPIYRVFFKRPLSDAFHGAS